MLHTCVLYSSRIYGEVLFRICGFGLPWDPPVLPPNVDQPTGLAAAPARPEKASLGIRNVKNGRGGGGKNLKMGTKDRAEGSKRVIFKTQPE